MKKLLTFASLALLAGTMMAQNPVIRDQFTADPTARVFNGKVYLFPSHDIPGGVQARTGEPWFRMQDYHVFSSEDLMNWTDHGVIVSQENVPWGNPNGDSMWAPDCVEKDGKYYFVFPNGTKTGRGFGIGIAVADQPEGPYTVREEPLAGVGGIDPCILRDDNGKNYLIWSGMGLRGAMLNDDFTAIIPETVTVFDREFPRGGLREGPFAFKRNGKYYLTFPWVQQKTETLSYAMSDNPLGPYKFMGLIMEESPTGCWTNHHSIVEYNGEWYLFYHHNDYSPEFDKNRSVRIDKIRFNADGTIQQVTPTLRGVGVSPACSRIQVDRYSQLYPYGTSIDFVNADNRWEGWFVTLGKPLASVRYNYVDFSSPVASVTLRVRSAKGAELEINNSVDHAKILATVKIPSTSKWKEVTFPVTEALTGIQDLTLKCLKGAVDIDWIEFK